MRTSYISPMICVLLLFAACTTPEKETVIKLHYVQADIQKAFDTLYDNQQAKVFVQGDSIITYSGYLEQALAHCHTEKDTGPVTQDVLSSMNLNLQTGSYDCITNTTFQFPGGTITANGIFNMVPGTTIAPDHDFPITGGSGVYKNIYGTYTRHYADSVYQVTLTFKNLP